MTDRALLATGGAELRPCRQNPYMAPFSREERDKCQASS